MSAALRRSAPGRDGGSGVEARVSGAQQRRTATFSRRSSRGASAGIGAQHFGIDAGADEQTRQQVDVPFDSSPHRRIALVEMDDAQPALWRGAGVESLEYVGRWVFGHRVPGAV